ncbi:MaoC/PaaZ C-terminal domain-containing protein [Pseudonocardia pini]|uniref:MaoC/PaaZ C-terminal domain-containing protein n=1 Tax=Pseudonocardia pini TaxID=2758030 RepID=UPI001C68B8EE|nr:MaoC/PaaZ C-terminal domain-containing protein [Pseudonocardia pini]
MGDSIPERELGPISQTDIVRFAGAGGDFNPLHHDAAFAEKAGFDTVIAMGQMQAGMLASWLTDWCGVEYLRELEVRFLAPVRLGALLRLTGAVTGWADLDGTPVAELELRASVGSADVVRGVARIAAVSANGRSAPSPDDGR